MTTQKNIDIPYIYFVHIESVNVFRYKDLRIELIQNGLSPRQLPPLPKLLGKYHTHGVRLSKDVQVSQIRTLYHQLQALWG